MSKNSKNSNNSNYVSLLINKLEKNKKSIETATYNESRAKHALRSLLNSLDNDRMNAMSAITSAERKFDNVFLPEEEVINSISYLDNIVAALNEKENAENELQTVLDRIALVESLNENYFGTDQSED